MKPFLYIWPWLLLLLVGPSVHAEDVLYYGDIALKRHEVPFYTFTEFTPQVALRVEYARHELLNMDEWKRVSPRSVAYQIDLVFTKYPEDTAAWRTNFSSLFRDRMEALFNLDPNLRDTKVRWNMVLQTKCKNEDQAKQFFHGFVIKYRPRKAKVLDEIKTPDQLKAMIEGRVQHRDTTVTSVLNRHPEWKKMLIVLDWTGSMYKQGAQLAVWHKYHELADTARISHFVFFNDGNHKKTLHKKIGKTGGVYRAKSTSLDDVVGTMEYVMGKGNGGDAPENDLEAVLTGIQYLDDYNEVILIADNKSAVRDIELLDKIDRPVRIILCDIQQRIHPHYIRLAKYTGGSIHTLKRDITQHELNPPSQASNPASVPEQK
ncbi:hypothetical protein [Pontibacter sp. G13]|uniref:hypothetical protein n=1 Tax=Pontibacter sp. G13 TaxID=3074898 RepID=UPI002889795B|nr:hypothetical protein [Pontibacter sp. G13]WNJ18760.1 hypothetical protein RJD25_28220 [Pontibacter sp. G13]